MLVAHLQRSHLGRRTRMACSALRRARALLIAVVVAIALFSWHLWQMTLGGNIHNVVPGAIYRSARLDTDELRRLTQEHQLRTIVNLEGQCADAWYEQEHALSTELDVRVLDVGIWASVPPSSKELCMLVDTLSEAPTPILVHCRSGCDRSGLACAMALLLRTSATPDEARRQLSMYYGHNPFGLASCLDHVLDDYEAWLREQGFGHEAGRLRQWAHTTYTPRPKPTTTGVAGVPGAGRSE